MNTELVVPVSKEEIEWVRTKHAGIIKDSRRMLKEALKSENRSSKPINGWGSKKALRGGEWRSMRCRNGSSQDGLRQLHPIADYMRRVAG